MAKAKIPKMGLSFLSSFQICRPKNPSSMIKSPLPAVPYVFSPLNSKTFNISFPSFPNAPPSTPSKITQRGSACQSKPCIMQEITQEMSSGLDDEFTPHAYSKSRNEGKMCTSPASDEMDWQTAPSRTEKKKNKSKRKKSKAGISDHETERLFSSPPSYSNHPLKTIYEEELSEKPMKQTSVRARRFKRYGSKEWKEGEEFSYHEKKPISGPCMVDGKVKQSFVVVKRSVDPYEDFKKSMREMILEKQIFEPKELEQLLMSFLSLNSRLHHKVIIEAFTEILKVVFCG